MASWVFSSIQSLSSKVLEAVRGTTSHPQDPASSAANQNEGVREDLEKLSRMLVRIQAVLQDAEEREIRDMSVRLWLQELRGVAYQAEDVLDEFHYELLKSIVESGEAAIESYHQAKSANGTKRKYSEMCTSSSLATYSSTITRVSIPDVMAEKIKGITERFEEISKARRDLHLREEDGTRLVTGPEIRPPTSSHVDERAIFGRNEEKSKIISLMNPSNGPEFMVLPIVGMGGFGKTTLAQLVFNDSRIHILFNKRCWVYVSEDFDLLRLTKAIVDSVSDSPCEFTELSQLQDVLKEKLRVYSLFLVLDDVWNEKKNLWELFVVSFLGAKTVRILTTTRHVSVAKIMQTTLPFQLGSLPNKNCWSLFTHFAFGNRTPSESKNLHKIGHRIVIKCKGSPLAIKALGGILHYETDEEKWREILESDISEIHETQEIMPALRLSYHKLPLHLRPCFLYLSMFPKGTPFGRDMMVRLWIAQGYINCNTTNYYKPLEKIGSEYFDELQGRSLIDRDYSGTYFLHDLTHDLARSISQDAFHPVIQNYQQWDSSCIVRHLFLTREDELLSSILAPKNCSIRTFVKKCRRSRNFDFAIINEIAHVRALQLRYSLLPDTLGTLKHLRYLSVVSHIIVLPETLCLLYNLQTLDLDCFFLQGLPENIKNLINLRYFKLTSGKIQQLPESIFLLRNLHTLSLRNCKKLKELPRGIQQLTSLHIIDLPISLIKIPFGIGKLTTLEPLSGYFSVMDHGIAGGLGELKDMNKLSGLLHISGLKNICDVENSRSANLASKITLNKLILDFQERQFCRDDGLHLAVHSSNNAKNKNDEKMQEVVLETLQPHGNLTELKILHYGGRRSPSWLFNSLLPKLTVITLDFCSEPNCLPSFSQLKYLRYLKISGGTSVMDLGDEFSTYSLMAGYGTSKQPHEVSYPSLEVLSLSCMLNLVEWQADDGDFPSLNKIIIENCPRLWKITKIPPQVRAMLITDCGCHELQFSSESKIRNILISNCPNLILVHSARTELPDLEKISFRNCPRLCKFSTIYKLPALRSILLDYCPELWLFPTIPEELGMLEILNCGLREIMLPSRCEKLIILNCLQLTLVSWRDGDQNNIVNVTFVCCPKLKFLNIPAQIKDLHIHECGFHEIMVLLISENLYISNCLELISINWKDSCLRSAARVTFMYCPKLELLNIPAKIMKLDIQNCDLREIILQSRMENPEIENLTISNCQELISISWSGGASIAEFTVENCPQFKYLTLPSVIKDVKINRCGFREIMLPSKSEKLTISNCLELNSINWKEGHLNCNEELTFQYCPKLTLPTIPSGIKKLKIAFCGIDKVSFPHQSRIEMVDISHCPVFASIHWSERGMLKDSPKLHKGLKNLRVSDCPLFQITTKEVFNSMVTKAEIYDCPMIESDKVYVYQRDGTVTNLNISGDKYVHLLNASGHYKITLLENSFKLHFAKDESPEESLSCPPLARKSWQFIMLTLPSLVILEIWRCRKVISIEGLDNLSNLKRLSISGCPELCNWEDNKLPLSLEFLELASCEKLSSMPLLSVENLSSTLKALVIIKCPLLDVTEGSYGLMNLETLEILHCKNVNISPATESIKFKPHFTICDCPLMGEWCQRNSITSVQGQVQSCDN